MKQYHLVYKKDTWIFAPANTGRPIKKFTNKEEAIRWAANYIRETGFGGSLVVHKIDGKFQNEFTYPRSADPRRSKG